MQVRKWGDGLAVRLPDDLVRTLAIEEGDELEIDEGHWHILRNKKRQTAIEKLKALAVDPPPGFRFSRSDAHERGGG